MDVGNVRAAAFLGHVRSQKATFLETMNNEYSTVDKVLLDIHINYAYANIRINTSIDTHDEVGLPSFHRT